ncbi:MAG: PTS transporter subunit EIIA [Proteobacteria bacterium]|nr:PTS transporter subunit EIIA [Pseudomonadota bacterium]
MIHKLLRENFMILHLKAKDKKGVLEELSNACYERGFIDNPEELFRTLMEREKVITTGIGRNVALPHARTDVVKRLHLIFAKSDTGVDCDSLDGKPVYLFFLFIGPNKENKEYIKILAEISRLVRIEQVRKTLLESKTEEDVFRIIKENEKLPE